MPSITAMPQLAIRVRRSLVPTYSSVDGNNRNSDTSEESSGDNGIAINGKAKGLGSPKLKKKLPLKLHFRPKVLMLTNIPNSFRNKRLLKYSFQSKVVCYARDCAMFEQFLITNLRISTSQSILVFLHYKVRDETDELGLIQTIDRIYRQVTSLENPARVRVEAFIRTNGASYSKVENHFKKSGTVTFVVNDLEN